MERLQSIDETRSGRHRRGVLARAVAVLSDWFHQPFDYAWILTYPSTRSLHRVIKSVIAAGVLLYMVASATMLLSPQGPEGASATGWVLFVFVMQAAAAWYWFSGRLPNRWGTIAFGLFADLGLASVLATYRPVAALTGCALFAISGAYFTYFVSPRWLVAHLVFSITFIDAMAVRAYTAQSYDVATIVAGTVVILGAVAGVPLFAHLAWTIITRDARRAALDPLTGLYNRRGWDGALEELWSRGFDKRHTLAVFLIDIDKFKRVNDRFGHDVGDAVIRLLARRLETLFGDHGIIARTGGEEFLAAVTGDVGLIEGLIDRIGDALYNSGDQVPVTASVGVAVLDADSDLWDVGVTIVVRAGRVADSMMYRAKDAGGDRVLSAAL
ncbi:diguanylate cyclase [Actinomycetes bacterium M1A6_2h]